MSGRARSLVSVTLSLACLLGTACSDQPSVIELSVTADPALPSVDRLAFSITQGADDAHAAMSDVLIGASLPPARSISFAFDPGVTGDMHVSAVAYGAGDAPLGRGEVVVAIAPADVAHGLLTITPKGSSPLHLAFSGQPGATQAGATIPGVRIAVLDDRDQPVVGSDALVTIALGATTAAGTLSGTVALAAPTGEVAFSDLHLDEPGTYTLGASAPGTTGAQSSTFEVGKSTFAARSRDITGGSALRLSNFDGNLYAAMGDAGVFRSTDGAQTWSPFNPGLDGLELDQIVGTSWASTNPGSDKALYALSLGGASLYRTVDGTSWNKLAANPLTTNNASVACAGRDLTLGYWGNGGVGQIWTSPDRGDTITPSGTSGQIYALGMNGSVTYASTASGLEKTITGLSSWTYTAANPGSPIDQIVVDRNDGNKVWVALGNDGIKFSTNGGTTFAPFGTSWPASTSTRRFAVSSSGAVLVIAAGNGVSSTQLWRADSSTAAWALVSASAAGEWMNDLLIDGSTLYAATGTGGVLSSTDGGQTFKKPNLGLTADSVQQIIGGATPSRLFAITRLGAGFGSTDRGQTWTRFAGASSISGLAADPTDPQIIYVTSSSHTVRKSIDGGATFTDFAEGLPFSGDSVGPGIAIDPKRAGALYLCGYDTLYERTGAAWTAITVPGLDAPLFGACRTIALHPTDPKTLWFADSNHAVFRTTDGGVTWARVDIGVEYDRIEQITVNPSRPTELYVRSHDGHLYRSSDGGVIYTPFTALGLPTGRVKGMVCHPTRPDVVVLAIDGQGLFRSVDGGKSFAAMNDGLPSLFLRSVWMDPTNPSGLIVGTADSGLWSTLR